MATRTHCPYCALQCGVWLRGEGSGPWEVTGDRHFPVNRGRLCVKGFTAAATLGHPERLTTPLVRGRAGDLEAATWEDAFRTIAERVGAAQRHYGRDAVGVFGSGSLTNEKAYLLGKFARVALGTSRIDYNGRYCMSSAAAASNRVLGMDRGLPFPVSDIAGADVILLAGGNLADTMPPIMQWVETQRAAGGKLIVADPRQSATVEAATHHLALAPGTDGTLAHGLMHLLVRENLIDERYIADRTEGFDQLRALVAGYWPSRVERITGVSEEELVEAAKLLGRAERPMILTGRGPEQQARGVANAGAYLNLALALGAVGKPSAGYGCLTGQGNGQGGREHGQKCDQLPGYRDIRDPEARRHMAAVWDVAEESIPGPGLSAQEMLSSLGADGGVRALLVFGSNPVVSAADATAIEQRIRALDLLVVTDFFLSETAALADVVLPAAQWAEEEGTMTNLEGRVIRRRAASLPPPGVRTDIDIVCGLAAALGAGERFDFASPEAVFDELRRASAGGIADYAGITYDRIDRESGVYWPCPSTDHPGTPRLFTDSFPTPSGRARFFTTRPQETAEEPDADFPLRLTTGRLLAHYQTGTQTHRVDQLEQISPEPVVQVHPSTAHRYGVAVHDEVVLTTRRASARFAIEITTRIRPDTLFIPFHWGGQGSANRLTNPALDPVSGMPEFKVCAVRIERSVNRELD